MLQTELTPALLAEGQDACSWNECPRKPVYAIRFHDQVGHVHECEQHTATLREWANVAEIIPYPCSWGHGTTWIDTPTELT